MLTNKSTTYHASQIQWGYLGVRLGLLITCIYFACLSTSSARAVLAYDPHFRLPWPAGIPYAILSSSYSYAQGDHFDYSNPLYKDYYAIDFGLGTNLDVAAVQGGYASTHTDVNFGNYIEIDHGNRFTTVYAHLTSFSVGNGQVVQGQVIGKSGCTGNCQGAHLHFSARYTDGSGTKSGYMPEPMSGYTGFGNYGLNRGTSSSPHKF